MIERFDYLSTELFRDLASNVGAWSGMTPNHTNMMFHQIVLVSSGVLAAGEYKIRINVRENDSDLEATIDTGVTLTMTGKNSAIGFFTGAISGVHLEVATALSAGKTITAILSSTNTDMRPAAEIATSSIDHGGLGGLLDNDHTQYLNAAGDTASIDLTLTGQLVSGVVLPAGVDHDSLQNYVAGHHVLHTGVVLTAGVGLSGGGDISVSRSFALDLNELTTSILDTDGDFFAVVDSLGAQNKLTKANIALSGFNNDLGWNAYVHPNHTGDVTSVGDGAQTIVADAVTYAKIQNVVANNVLLGNIAGAGGIVTEITAAQIRSLINVEDGATADQTAAEVLALLLTVDGSGSGLDADLLDGVSSAGFSLSGHVHVEADITDLQNYAVIGGAFHDGFSDFVANEHTDWGSTTRNLSTSGTGTFGGTILEPTGLGEVLHQVAGDQFLVLSGGSSNILGGGIVLWGESSASANDINFRSSFNTVLWWDNSADHWDFRGKAIVNTSTVDGRDLSVDGTKLDGIEAGATADQTSIVGIGGTKTQFNTELSDGDFIFVGDAPTAHTHTHASTTGQGTDDHHPQSHTIASHSDTTATGAELETLTNNSIADTLHRHSELVASDGSPDPSVSVDASGNVGIGTTDPKANLHVAQDDADAFLRISQGPGIDGAQTIGDENRIENFWRQNRVLGATPGGYIAFRSEGNQFSSGSQLITAIDFAVESAGVNLVTMVMKPVGDVLFGVGNIGRKTHKTTDETITNDSTLSNDSDLTVAVEANTNYRVEIALRIDATANSSFKWAVAVPTSAVLSLVGAAGNSSSVGNTAIEEGSSGEIVTGSGVTKVVSVSGVLKVVGTAGNVVVQWSQQASHADSTTLLEGSHMILTKLL